MLRNSDFPAWSACTPMLAPGKPANPATRACRAMGPGIPWVR